MLDWMTRMFGKSWFRWAWCDAWIVTTGIAVNVITWHWYIESGYSAIWNISILGLLWAVWAFACINSTVTLGSLFDDTNKQS